MKNILMRILLLAIVAISFSACNDRNAEKKIAELESRLKELEGKKTPGPATGITPATPVTQPLQDEKPEGPLPTLQFETTDHDFGTINEGKVVEYTYKFKNTSQVFKQKVRTLDSSVHGELFGQLAGVNSLAGFFTSADCWQ
jgi:hypothetical protein